MIPYMKKLLTVALMIVLCLSLAACEKDKEVYTGLLSPADAAAVTLTEEAREMLDDIGAKGNLDDYKAEDSSAIPDSIIGVWEPFEVYQEARASSESAQEAFESELEQGVYIGYDEFSCSACTITSPVYSLCAVSMETLESLGVQTEPLTDELGDDAGVLALSVLDSKSGEQTSVFFIDDERMLYFGESLHVFTASRLDAVG